MASPNDLPALTELAATAGTPVVTALGAGTASTALDALTEHTKKKEETS